MDALREKIIEEIRRKGPITFEAFMEMAIYEPGLGYYASPETEIGRAGDFYTSPHLHPVFGAMLGRQMEEMWEIMGRPSGFGIIEMGAGRGYLSKDMLEYLSTREIFKNITYHIVELSPFMAEKQKALLSGFREKVKWVSSLRELGPVTGCVLSNELLDSFPVHIVEMEDELKEVYVSYKDDAFYEVKGSPCTGEISDYFKEFSVELPQGYRTEVNLRVRQWIKEVSEALRQGFVLTIDYGYPASDYYSEERTRGTLLCYRGHEVSEDPYGHVGRQDITAHVNFSALKKWGEEAGLTALGFCPQGAYLVSLGIDEAITELFYSGSPDYPFEAAKMKGLILPGTIGETHKVMAQYKGFLQPPSLRGFSLRNHLRHL